MTNLEYLYKKGLVAINAVNKEFKTIGLNILIELRDKDYKSFKNKKDINWLCEEHKEPIKLKQWEYDILELLILQDTLITENGYTRKLKERGHFKGAVDTTMTIKEILFNCKIVSDDYDFGGNENE